MKSAILANAALCLCPPLLATTAVATMPAVRHAMHRLAAPSYKHILKDRKLRPPCAAGTRLTGRLADSGEIEALTTPPGSAEAEPMLGATAAEGVEDPPAFLKPQPSDGYGYVSTSFPVGPGPLVGPPPVPPISPVAPLPPPAVPEPASWAMMITGFFGVGLLCRRGRRPAGTARLARAVAMIELVSSATLAPGGSAMIGPTKAGAAIAASLARVVAKKALVCVCSGALVATAVTIVPPVRRAVYAATLPVRSLATDNCTPSNDSASAMQRDERASPAAD